MSRDDARLEDTAAGLDAQGGSFSLLPRPKIVLLPREPDPATGKRKTMDSPSDAEVIGRSVDEPEAFGLVYDRHAATVLRFLGRRVGVEAAEGLLGELFRIAFERRKTFDSTRACCSRAWLTRLTRCRTRSARPSCFSSGRSSRTRAWPRLSSCPSARCA